MSKDALLEIGVEELPASFVTLGIAQLKALAEKSLAERQLPVGSIHAYGTPRRLAVSLLGVGDRSQDQEKRVVGPPAAMAKDADGNWTPAATGFARKQGVKASDLIVDNGRLCTVLHVKGTPTRTLLAELFPSWIKALEFPKAMTWEPTHFRFPRPIRWLGAVYGSDLVSFSLAGVRSGRWTFGLALQSKKVALTAPGKYVGNLKNQCVLVEPSARQEAIRRLADQAVKRIHGHVLLRQELLEQVANLVEHPVAILGNFDPAYLNLPSEVLITCLEHHQKFFPVTAAQAHEKNAGEGKLLPHFVGIRNGMSVHQEIVKEGYERVLAARLADARFFYQQDRKTALAKKVEALKGVMFQEKLGNLFEKKDRVKRFIDDLAKTLPSSPWREPALRVAELCKADLVTDMVREFPELQGIMARVYALADQEDAVVAQGLEQQYWPITLTSPLPESWPAAVAAVADKLDTLAGDFAVGLIPTGSADPYGLRRAAVGVLRILEDNQMEWSVETLLEKAVQQLPENLPAARPDTLAKLNQFMRQRFAALLAERGFRFDEIDAVLEIGIGPVHDAVARLNALRAVRARPEFSALSTAFKRAMNIVRQAKKAAFDESITVQPALFKEPSEGALYQSLSSIRESILSSLQSKAYENALTAFVPLQAPLNDFFAGVMVMAEDLQLRQNRLALMNSLVQTFNRFADFSKLQDV